MFVFVLFLCLLSLSLFVQSFSQDHTGFFFSSENEKKLSSKVSALKAELNLYRAEMETERQTHQKEEKALRARVVEAEKQKDATVESMKNECKGIVGSFVSFCILASLSADFSFFLLYSDFLFY